MALTADELSYVRSMLPTVASTDPAFVTDDQLNYLHSNKAGSDTDKTIAYALRQMCTKLSSHVARTNTATGDTVQSQQEREAVCARADEWARLTGTGKWQAITATAAHVYRADSLQTEAPDYSTSSDEGDA